MPVGSALLIDGGTNVDGVCTVCGTRNPAIGKFCGQCGTSLAAGCPSCGAPVAAEQRFCNECGISLVAPGAASAPAPVTERRVCTVLFADLVGFTTLAESRDPEQVRELLSRYFEVARTVVGRYGGTIEKFIGDAVMAVWGTPVAVEGDAERAVRAAIDLLDAIADLGVAAGVPGLSLRAGVVTGEVAVTIGATSEGMVAGDAVNTAARVQSAATPGSVWVDSATQRMAAAAIAFDDMGAHPLKGKTEPLHLWQVGRVLSGFGGAQRVDGLEAQLSGRDAELRTIRELFHAAAERSSPRLVTVTGAAGIGKSRLGWEFEKYIDGLADIALWHRGRCLSYGDGVVFWALGEMVRQRFGIAEDDPQHVMSAKLVELLPGFVPDASERAYVGARLGRLLGVESFDEGTAPLGREELFAGWRLFFERLAATSPVVLLFEDAQHADPALLDFIDHLVDWAHTAPIFVLAFARPEIQTTRPGWGSGRNRSALTLDPLDAGSMSELLADLVPGLPAPAMKSIAEQAQGNPLFAVETVRSLIDRDAVVPIDGVYRLVGDVGSLSVPDSLHALLAARLDALEPHLRTLAADAAILGSTFPIEALVAVSGQPFAPVDDALRELLRRGVLEISADPLSPQRGAYYFSQNMLRQVAYDTLSRRDRKARHLAVAGYLRDTFASDGDEVSDVLARHYLDAADAVPEDPDAAGIRAQGVTELVRAADRAARSGAPVRAAETYARAAGLTSAGDPVDSAPIAAELWERAASQHDLVGAHDDALRDAGEAGALYRERQLTRAAARADVVCGRCLGLLGRHKEAREVLTSALAVLRNDPDHDTVIALRELAGLNLFSRYPGGDDLSREALDLGEALDAPPAVLASLLIIRGIGFLFDNRYVQATAALEHAARLAERVGDTAVRARALGNLSIVFTTTDPATGAVIAQQACDYARRVGASYNLVVAVNNLFFALLATGDWAGADRVVAGLASDNLHDTDYGQGLVSMLAAVRGDAETASSAAALSDFRRSDEVQETVAAHFADAWAAFAAGRIEQTLAAARTTIELGEPISLSYERVYWGWPLATRAAFLLGDLGAVDDLVALLDRHPVGHLPPILRAERTLARARLLAVRGDDAAAAGLDGALAELRDVASPYHLAQALLDVAEYARARSDVEKSDALTAEAVAIAERLRVQPVLDRVDSSLRHTSAPGLRDILSQ